MRALDLIFRCIRASRGERRSAGVAMATTPVQLTEAQEAAAREVFEVFDQHGTGTISAAELSDVFDTLGQPLSAAEMVVGGAIERIGTCSTAVAVVASSEVRRSCTRSTASTLGVLVVAPVLLLGTLMLAVTRIDPDTTLSCTYSTGTPR